MNKTTDTTITLFIVRSCITWIYEFCASRICIYYITVSYTATLYFCYAQVMFLYLLQVLYFDILFFYYFWSNFFFRRRKRQSFRFLLWDSGCPWSSWSGFFIAAAFLFRLWLHALVKNGLGSYFVMEVCNVDVPHVSSLFVYECQKSINQSVVCVNTEEKHYLYGQYDCPI